MCRPRDKGGDSDVSAIFSHDHSDEGSQFLHGPRLILVSQNVKRELLVYNNYILLDHHHFSTVITSELMLFFDNAGARYEVCGDRLDFEPDTREIIT